MASNTCTLVYRFVVNQCTCKTYRSDAAVMDPASISATQLHAVVCRPSVPCLSLTRTKTSTKVSTPSVKKQTPMTFWLGFIKKAQTSVISDRDSCTLSVHVHLQVTSLMLLRTICSFHGNDSRRVGAVGWLGAGDCPQSDRQWRKQFRAFMKAEGEHFEHLLWLAVAYWMLLDAWFQMIFKCLSYFHQHRDSTEAVRMTHDR